MTADVGPPQLPDAPPDATSTEAADGPHSSRGAWIATLVTLGAIVVGCLATGLATRHGSGMAGDGHAYVASARNVIAGNWVTFEDYTLGNDPKPLEQFPPGYPLLLAGGGLFGMDVIPFSRLLNIAVMALTLGLAGWLLWTHTRSIAATAVGVFTFALSTTTLFAHSNILSEGVYVACIAILLAGLIGAYRNLHRPWLRTALLCIAAVAAGWSCTIRYAGIFLIFVGIASILLWPTPSDGRFRLTLGRRAMATAVFTGIALLFPAAVATFNLWILGRPTSRPFAVHPPTLDKFRQLFETVGYWLQPALNDQWMTDFREVIGAVALVAMTVIPLAWLVVRLRRRERPTAWAVTLFLFAVGYTPFIVVAHTFQDAGIPFNKRIFMPLWFAGWVFVVGTLGRGVRHGDWPRPLRWSVIALAAVVVVCNLAAEAQMVRARHNYGWAFEGPRWEENQILQTIRMDHGSVAGKPLVSNMGDLIGLVTDRRSAHVPKWFSRPRRKAYSKMPNRIRQFGRWAMANDARIIYFTARDNSDFLAPYEMLDEYLHLRLLVEKRAGSIYEVTAIKGFEDEDYNGDGRADGERVKDEG